MQQQVEASQNISMGFPSWQIVNGLQWAGYYCFIAEIQILLAELPVGSMDCIDEPSI